MGSIEEMYLPLTVYSPFELISLVFSTSKGWHKKVAQPPCRKNKKESNFTLELKTPAKLHTYSDEAREEVCKNVISH